VAPMDFRPVPIAAFRIFLSDAHNKDEFFSRDRTRIAQFRLGITPFCSPFHLFISESSWFTCSVAWVKPHRIMAAIDTASVLNDRRMYLILYHVCKAM
jgi:hypothetical protein